MLLVSCETFSKLTTLQFSKRFLLRYSFMIPNSDLNTSNLKFEWYLFPLLQFFFLLLMVTARDSFVTSLEK